MEPFLSTTCPPAVPPNEHDWHKSLRCMAGLTGLEPATSCVTGRRSNQLNYNPARSKAAP